MTPARAYESKQSERVQHARDSRSYCITVLVLELKTVISKLLYYENGKKIRYSKLLNEFLNILSFSLLVLLFVHKYAFA